MHFPPGREMFALTDCTHCLAKMAPEQLLSDRIWPSNCPGGGNQLGQTIFLLKFRGGRDDFMGFFISENISFFYEVLFLHLNLALATQNFKAQKRGKTPF